MKDRLRECPCGHSAHIIFEDGTKVSDPWSIACKNFDCPWVFQTFPSREKAISAWNTRATDPLITAALSWWECKRPTLWSVEEHANNPTVNCINDREKALAVEVAKFVAGGGEDGR